MTNLTQMQIPSPVGEMTVIMDGDTVILAEFSDQPERIEKYLAKHHASKTVTACKTDNVESAFAAYFAGNATALDEIKINASGSDFDRTVWAALRTIPAGTTWSYADLANTVSSHPRAVGGANGRNPIALITPCHRVIGKDGSLTGYAGGVERKKWLLGIEDTSLNR